VDFVQAPPLDPRPEPPALRPVRVLHRKRRSYLRVRELLPTRSSLRVDQWMGIWLLARGLCSSIRGWGPARCCVMRRRAVLPERSFSWMMARRRLMWQLRVHSGEWSRAIDHGFTSERRFGVIGMTKVFQERWSSSKRVMRRCRESTVTVSC
jgi:hypothetical protein